MANALTTRPKVGDEVSVDSPKYPGIWTVASTKGSANALLQQGDRRLKAAYELLTEPTEAPASVPLPTLYHPGELIRVTGKFAGLYVVIADRGGDRVNLAKLGGEGGRYLRHSKRGLVKVAPEDVLK